MCPYHVIESAKVWTSQEVEIYLISTHILQELNVKPRTVMYSINQSLAHNPASTCHVIACSWDLLCIDLKITDIYTKDMVPGRGNSVVLEVR